MKMYSWHSYAYEGWEYGATFTVVSDSLDNAKKSVIKYLMESNTEEAIPDIDDEPAIYEIDEVMAQES